MSMLTDMLERYRIREGLSVPRAAYLIGLTPREYRRILAGEPIVRYETWQRICDLYGWPQTFAGASTSANPSRGSGDAWAWRPLIDRNDGDQGLGSFDPLLTDCIPTSFLWARRRLRMLRPIVLCALLVGALVPTVPARATPPCSVESVGGESFDTLQAAVDAASEGDSLWVTGTCVGKTTIPTSLRIVGMNGATLDGGASGSVITTRGGITLTLRDLTVTNGRAPFGGGINAGDAPGGYDVGERSGRLFLRGMTTVTGNHGQIGGGVFAGYGGVVRLFASSSVSGNTGPSEASGGGAGILAHTVVLHGSASVSDNAVFGRGGGILATRVALHDQATVSGNTSTYPGIIDPRSEGGGIFAERVKVDDDASVMDNASEQNAGGILGRFVRLRDDATVGGNTTLEYGGGVMVRHLWDTSARSKLEMDGAARITGNSAGIGGGGAFLEPTAKLYVCSDAVVLSPNSPDDPPVALACT